MGKAKNYVGTKIGKFEILEQYSKNYIVYLKAKCTLCGKVAWISQKHIGTQKCCETNYKTQYTALDLKGKTINGIKLLEKTDKRYGNMVVWKCKCHCGNIFYAPGSEIKTGRIKSCGCYTPPAVSNKVRQKGTETYAEKYLKEGTNLSAISGKMLSTNTSGVKGVFYSKSKNRWVAHLIFKGESHRKTFRDKENAIKCRKEWEEKYFKLILDKYKKESKETE